MLEVLLSKIRAGGSFEITDLASQMGTTPEMVRVMLEHLQRSGHLQRYRVCDDGCCGCDLSDGCKVKAQTDGVRLWQG